jgi:SAM-dependent methyltransferase
MNLNWIDVSDLSFNTLLLLEREQLTWLPGWLPEPELGTALKGNPAVEWYLRHKNPKLGHWVDTVLRQANPNASEKDLRSAEEVVLQSMNDLVCYAVAPECYEDQPFLAWDSEELRGLVDFRDKTVVDVGAGTGRLTFIAAMDGALGVFSVEPVGNLLVYIKEKTRKLALKNVYTMDGLITDLPFPDNFVDIVMGGHVFGDSPEAEYAEMLRIVKLGGRLILCPGNNDTDDGRHTFLVDQGFKWSSFEEPGDGIKRKYWKTVKNA